jgi:hypothetical protein
MPTSTNIPAINPYVTTVRDTDPMILRVPMHKTGIGATPGTLKAAYPSGSQEMGITHVGGTTAGRK